MGTRSTGDRVRRGASVAARCAVGLVCVGMANACSISHPPVEHSRAGGGPLANAPNVVLVLLDDLELGAFQYMPLTQQLVADSGVRFDSAFVSAPLCCPSRVSLLRGQYAHNTGVVANGGRNGGFAAAYRLGVERSTIATWLRGAGYRTGLFGKYLNFYPDGVDPTYVPPGWSTWAVPVRGTPYSGFRYTLNLNGSLREYGSEASDYATDVLRDLTLQFVTDASRADVPFLAVLSTFAPHSPSIPAPRHGELFPDVAAPVTPATTGSELARKPSFMRDLPIPPPSFVTENADSLYRLRLQSLQAVDEAVAQLVATLRDLGELERTLIIVTSDNGYHFAAHGLPAGKETVYEDDIRVPLVARGLGVPAGQRVGHMVLLTDLAPTIAELAGITPELDPDGRSLVPLLRGETVGPWRRAVLLSRELPEHLKRRGARLDSMAASTEGLAPPAEEPADRGGDDDSTGIRARNAMQRGVAALPSSQRRAFQRIASYPSFRGVRTDDGWSYVRHEGGEEELYDLQGDAHQLRNLVPDSASDARVAHQLSRLRRWTTSLMRCRGKACHATENADPLGPPAPLLAPSGGQRP